MSLQTVEGVHAPQTKLVLKAISEVEKEDALCGQAEKRALPIVSSTLLMYNPQSYQEFAHVQ